MKPILLNTPWLVVYSYPLLMGIAWGVAFRFGQSQLIKKKFSLAGFKLLFLGIFGSSWIGAKLLFLATYTGDIGLSKSEVLLQSNFWFGGGFVFYGGLIFGTIFSLVYCLLFKKFDLKNFQLFMPVITLSHGIGRLGCFLAGCCYGGFCDLPWAVSTSSGFRHPVQLYESILLFLMTWYFYRKTNIKNRSQFLIELYFITYAIVRFVLEFFRGDLIRGGVGPVSTSQVVSIIIVVLSIQSIYFRKKSSVQ